MTFQGILKAIKESPLPEEKYVPPGLELARIRAIEKQDGIALPDVVVDWLSACNGPYIGNCTFTGLDRVDALDIRELAGLYPGWTSRKWTPVAADGCGNYYVLFGHPLGWPVGFVDTGDDPDVVTYLVASDLRKFILAVLSDEAEDEGLWPFDKAHMLKSDPDLVKFGDAAPLPWDT